MHSLKNTVVAVLLLGVSYGVYEVLTTPDPSLISDESLIGPLVISDGSEPDESAPQPHIQLPDAVALTPNSSFQRPNSNQKMNVESSSTAQPSAALDYSAQPPSSSESIISRHPKMDFGSESDSGNHLAGAELPDDQAQLPHDHELIEALKQHLGPENSAASEVAPKADTKLFGLNLPPVGQKVSTAAIPISTAPIPESQPVEIDYIQPPDGLVPPIELPAGESQIAPAESVENSGFADAWQNVQQLTEQGQFRSALKTLTQYYNDSSLTADQQQKLLEWLDALAGKVIYSSEHNFLPESYVIQPDETLPGIAKRWNVTDQLVYNVNRGSIPDPSRLSPGNELKVIKGPFHGELDVSKKVLTVFVDDLYAGRFSVEVNDQTEMQAGRYRVTAKSEQPTSEEHGPYWIELDGGFSIHAVTGPMSQQHQGCIGLSNKDASDLFSIFTEDSLVFVKQ